MKKGFVFFKNNSITTKIISVTIFLVVIMAMALVVPFGILSYRNEMKMLEDLEELLYKDYDKEIKHQVETAYDLLEGVYAKYTDGDLTEEEAMSLAADLVRGLSYDSSGYFWIDTKEGTNVVLLGSDTEGKSRYNLKDAKGKLFIQEIIKAAVAGGGFTEYWFPKKGSDVAMPKRSYSMYFEPFNWVLGTGNYIDDIIARVEAEREQEMASLRQLILLMLVITVAVIALATIGAIVFGRSFSKPIILLSKETEKLSEGNLDITIVKNRNDEIGILQGALQFTVDKLKEVIGEVRDGAGNVASASGQMSKTAEYISQGASSQSASTEEISSSVEEMVASIQSNTENADVTEEISLNSEKSVFSLNSTLKENLDSMTEIKAKTNIINDIASQTNILALNAAVEAARAGEYGRGFAVVAAEVRKLSDYTQIAANEIDRLTGLSFNSAEQAWKNMEALLPQIKNTVERVREISVSSKEQDAGAGQINNAVQELVGVTSQNAASSEELASSSEELYRQAEQLKEIINFFKFKE
jgi:methyl-accepting chemotaxis protein